MSRTVWAFRDGDGPWNEVHEDRAEEVEAMGFEVKQVDRKAVAPSVCSSDFLDLLSRAGSELIACGAAANRESAQRLVLEIDEALVGTEKQWAKPDYTDE